VQHRGARTPTNLAPGVIFEGEDYELKARGETPAEKSVS